MTRGEGSAVTGTTLADKPAELMPGRRPAGRGVLGSLFPASAAPPRAPDQRLLGAVAQIVAVGIGTVAMLERIPGLPSWETIYGEDYWEYLTQALQQPWHLFITLGGYEQLLPRVLAQFAIYLPLAQVSRWFAVCGALIAAGCGLFVFHASAGHIRSWPLRAVLGAAVVLSPVAPMEIADSAVGAPWFLWLALFWALLWRPRTRAGMAVAALVAFAATSSEVFNVLFAPLVVARLLVLRRPGEHAVTAGWVAGCLLQVPQVLSSYLDGTSRMDRQQGRLGQSFAFYFHDTVLRSIGWRFSWRLESVAGASGATLIVAVALAVLVGAILITQPGNRSFVVTAMLTGFVFSMTATTFTPNVAAYPIVRPDLESGSRYSVLPIFLIEAIAIAGVDYAVRQRRAADHRRRAADRRRGPSLRPAIAISALVALLMASWVADFRYAGFRTDAAWAWAPIAARWEHACERSRSGEIAVKAGGYLQTLPCDRMRR